MRDLYPTGLLRAAIDRNPSNIQLAYNAIQNAQSVDTERAVYTVPANRRAILGCIELRVDNQIAQVGAFHTYARAVLNPAGVNKIIAGVDSHTLADATKDEVTISPNLILSAGDVISLRNILQGTTVNVLYEMYASLTEYDA